MTLAFDAVARSEGRFEAVSIIARDFAPYRSSLAREIARQGLPASGSAASPAPVARRARTLVELLERRDETPIGTLLALGGERLARSSGLRPWELRLAWASRGATRLETVCELRFDAGEQIRLPCRDTLRRSSETSLPRASRRTLSGSAVAAACAEVAEWRARLRRLAGPARLADAIAAVRELVAHLALDEEEGSALDRPLAALAEPPLGTLRVDSGELSALLREAWSELGARHLGGAGSGVALLTVTEARAMVFDHVVLLGLARDRFPRRVRSEPFLPDAVRVRLRDLLPDLPVKAEGHDEERFLFAQLLGAASSLDLLHSTTEGDGRKLTPSVFLDELARCGRIDGAEAAPPTEYPSAVDLARDAALAHGRKGLSAHLEAAIEDARHLLSEPGAPPQSAAEIAAHRVALLGELGSDPSGIGRDHLGPFFGFVGDRRDGDPRAPNPPVTTLEALARCGWRAFLEKVLRLQPLPADGEEIPELPRRLAGSALHRVLERFAPAERRRLGRSVEELAEETPSPVAWPEEARLKALGREAVHHVLIEEGFDPELFAAPLENVLAELLGIVHDLDWRSGSRELLGIEADGEGVLAYRGRERPLPFRADRVELEGETLLLTDYKVGRAVSDAARAETRSRHLWKEIARGERLQLVAYARATSPRPTCGRLLFVAPGLPDNAREVRLGSDELDAATLDQVFETLYDGWDRGSYLPRLLGD
ncbi:MAG: PD-(D/E)XK nuclease family protein, partial [Myxococcales bacterium]|nr:PD-(D/E)XK nuclease family protein [Myxococcales bacterium]